MQRFTPSMNTLVIASHNAGKIAEFRQLLQPLAITVVSQQEHGLVVSAEETASTFVENALIKARSVAISTKLPVLADDSGLCVPALHLAPGIHSARYAGTHGDNEANIDQLLAEMKHCTGQDRSAFFYCSLVLIRGPDDMVPLLCEGQWWGSIANERQGSGGFGYDPIFLPDDLDTVSAAELSPEDKNTRSHRGKAMQRLVRQLSSTD